MASVTFTNNTGSYTGSDGAQWTATPTGGAVSYSSTNGGGIGVGDTTSPMVPGESLLLECLTGPVRITSILIAQFANGADNLLFTFPETQEDQVGPTSTASSVASSVGTFNLTPNKITKKLNIALDTTGSVTVQRINYDLVQPAYINLSVECGGYTIPDAPEYPAPGSTIVATLINAGTVNGGPESYIATFGNKILFKKTPDQFVYSDDGGDTWTPKGFVPGFASNFRCQRLQYDPVNDLWYMLTGASTSDCAIHRSADNGLTWVALTMPSTTQYSSTSMILDSFGRIVFSARVSGGSMWIYRWDTPSTKLTRDVSYGYGGGASNHDNLKELVGFGYAISEWTGSQQNVRLVPYAMSSTTNVVAGLLEDIYDNIAWSDTSFNGEIYAWHTASLGNPRFIKVFNGMTSTRQYLTYDFAEDTEAYRVQNAGDYLLMLSQPTTVLSMWRLAYSFDAVNWVAEVNLVLPSDPNTDDGLKGVNIYSAGNGQWVGHYVSGSSLQLIRFNFT